MKILYIFSVSAFALKCEKIIIGEDAIELGNSGFQTFNLDDCFRQNDEYELTLEITCPTIYPAELKTFFAVNPDQSHTMSLEETKYTNNIETKFQGAYDFVKNDWLASGEYRQLSSSNDGIFQRQQGICDTSHHPDEIFIKFTLIQV